MPRATSEDPLDNRHPVDHWLPGGRLLQVRERPGSGPPAIVLAPYPDGRPEDPADNAPAVCRAWPRLFEGPHAQEQGRAGRDDRHASRYGKEPKVQGAPADHRSGRQGLGRAGAQGAQHPGARRPGGQQGRIDCGRPAPTAGKIFCAAGAIEELSRYIVVEVAVTCSRLRADVQALWQQAAAQAGRHLCPGGRSAGDGDLFRLLPVRLALDRKLVRCEGRGRLVCGREPGPHHARHHRHCHGERTRTASAQLSQLPDASAGLVLERIKDQLGADDVVLWSANAQAIASTGQSRFVLTPEKPSAALQRTASQQQRAFQIDGLDELTDLSGAIQGDPSKVRVKTLVQVANSDLGVIPDSRFLQATMLLPQALVVNALKVQEANREYQERALARDSLRSMYIGTLTLSLFLAVFGAVVTGCAAGLTNWCAPCWSLAEGVGEVHGQICGPNPSCPARTSSAR
ncbi:hypothetical protein FQA39_LY19332 [Lamprigera yunnana]|nr:hypothetical protein FQA39_LY19332 [Lamprigera yunnana]